MNQKNSKTPLYKNPLEALRESGSEVLSTTNNEVFRPMTEEFMNQILGRKRKFHGEIKPGESVEMRQIFNGKQEQHEKYRDQVVLERRLYEEERVLVEKRTGELRLQIEAIQVEVTKLAKATPRLAKEVEVASFQAPTNVTIYELFFLKHLFDFIKSFREHIEQAHVWLASTNARAHKKNVWGANYKKYGARYLMSGEHYSGRSSA